MKKLIIAAAFAAFSVAGAYAASEYMVYDFTLVAKTTKAKGATSASCGDEYVYRDGAATQRIRGIIAGCGCESILADGVCNNALVLLWNETTGKQIVDYTMSTWVVQRIGKNGTKAEHMAKIECENFEATFAGIGMYKNGIVNVNGNFAGTAPAPYLVTKGSCSACSSTPDTEDQTMALAPCDDGACEDAENAAVTPFYGKYTLKYNKSKSSKTSKNGVSAKSLGTPDYVDIDEGFFD